MFGFHPKDPGSSPGGGIFPARPLGGRLPVGVPTRSKENKLAWSNGYDVRLTRERFRVRSSVLVFCDGPRTIHPIALLLKSSEVGEQDSVSEWLRRWTRNPLGSARVGSNPTAVVLISYTVPLL